MDEGADGVPCECTVDEVFAEEGDGRAVYRSVGAVGDVNVSIAEWEDEGLSFWSVRL